MRLQTPSIIATTSKWTEFDHNYVAAHSKALTKTGTLSVLLLNHLRGWNFSLKCATQAATSQWFCPKILEQINAQGTSESEEMQALAADIVSLHIDSPAEVFLMNQVSLAHTDIKHNSASQNWDTLLQKNHTLQNLSFAVDTKETAWCTKRSTDLEPHKHPSSVIRAVLRGASNWPILETAGHNSIFLFVTCSVIVRRVYMYLHIQDNQQVIHLQLLMWGKWLCALILCCHPNNLETRTALSNHDEAAERSWEQNNMTKRFCWLLWIPYWFDTILSGSHPCLSKCHMVLFSLAVYMCIPALGFSILLL